MSLKPALITIPMWAENMEPPNFSVKSYLLGVWRNFRPQSARKTLARADLPAASPESRLLKMIHDVLPDGPYAELTTEQQSLLDAGIFIAANKLEQASAICRSLLNKNSVNREWLANLIAAIDKMER